MFFVCSLVFIDDVVPCSWKLICFKLTRLDLKFLKKKLNLRNSEYSWYSNIQIFGIIIRCSILVCSNFRHLRNIRLFEYSNIRFLEYSVIWIFQHSDLSYSNIRHFQNITLLLIWSDFSTFFSILFYSDQDWLFQNIRSFERSNLQKNFPPTTLLS